MVERAEWSGAIGPRPAADQFPVLSGKVGDSAAGGSGSFRGLIGTEHVWVKTINNPQHPRVPINEFIVSKLGLLIGAPVCTVRPVRITKDLAGEQARGHVLESGVASASDEVDGAVEERQLWHRDEDSNEVRHAGVYALYDWCWGGDDQWLYSSTNEFSVHSHDHGHYWPNGPAWAVADLEAHVGEAHPNGVDPAGLSSQAVNTLADKISGVTRQQLASILGSVPADWPITIEELEVLGWFLESRQADVATRLRALLPAPSPESGETSA